MKTNSSNALRNSSDPSHRPLARDGSGNLLALPDGTAAWMLKRETRGRPRTIVGQDKQPARFALDLTAEDIESMFGAATYRIYALDEVGNELDYVTAIRIASEESDDDLSLPPVQPRGGGSDLRFALETLREIARSQADALKAVAASQADWVKGLAVAKALPRNGPAPIPPPAPAPRDDDNDDDDDDEDDEDDEGALPPEVPGWLGAVAGISQNISSAMKSAADLRNAMAGKAQPTPSGSSSPSAMIHLSEINARLTAAERRHLNLVLRSKGGDGAAEELLAHTVDEAVEIVRDAMRGARAEQEPVAKDFMAHVLAAAAFLSAEEKAAVMWLMPRLPAARVEELKSQLLRMTAEDAASWVKEHLDELKAEVSS